MRLLKQISSTIVAFGGGLPSKGQTLVKGQTLIKGSKNENSVRAKGLAKTSINIV